MPFDRDGRPQTDTTTRRGRRTRRVRSGRHPLATLACLAGTVVLGGCVYDAAQPQVSYENRFDHDVVVHLEGEDRPFESLVKSGTFGGLGTDKCLGDAIVVETDSGIPVGYVDEPACPNWRLIVNEDGTLDYAELD